MIIFTGLSVPKFGKILNLVGGSTVAMTTFIMPPIFYIALMNQKDPTWEVIPVPKLTRYVLIAIAVVGVVGGVASTYSSLKDMFAPNALTAPCYAW